MARQQVKQFNLVVHGESHSERSKVKVIMGKYENYLVNIDKYQTVLKVYFVQT